MRTTFFCAIMAVAIACKGSQEPPATQGAGSPQPTTAEPAAPPRDVALAVVTAVDYEFAAVYRNLQEPRPSLLGGREIVEGTIAGHRVVVMRAGWGKAHAAGATALLLERYHPQRVLMAGIAGSLVGKAATSGDVVIIDGTLQHDLGKAASSGFQPWPPESPTGVSYGEVFHAQDAMVALLWASIGALSFKPWTLSCKCHPEASATCSEAPRHIGREHPRACVGVAASGDVFVADTVGAAAIASRAHSVIVDMETAAVAQECANHGVPFAAVRVVADVVAQDGESLYECLKPHTGQRLSEIMAATLPNLVAGQPHDTSPPRACAADLTVTSVEATLAREQLRAKARSPTLQLR